VSLARGTVVRIAWSFGSFLVERVLGLVVLIVLARLLAPDTFAIIAAATLVATLIDAMRDFGIREALVHNDREPESTADTGFLIALAVGILQGLLLLAAAPLGRYLVDDPAIVDMLRLMASVFPIMALGSVHDALLSKKLRFGAKALGDIAAAATKLVVVVVLLQQDVGIWSFAYGMIASAVVRTAARWLSWPWRPRLRFSIERARSLLRFGSHVTIVSVVDPLVDRTDQFAVALLLGDRQLAFYVVALRLPELLISSSTLVFSRVLFPTFVTLNDDPTALTAAFLRATRVSMIILAPVAVGLAVIAGDLVPLIFGKDWIPAVPVLQVSCLGILAVSAAWYTGDVYKARGRPEWTTRRTAIEMAVTIPVVWVTTLAAENLTATAAAMAGCMILASVLRVILTMRDLDRPVGRFVAAIAGSLGAAAGMAAVVWLVRSTLTDPTPLTATLVGVPVGMVAYGIMILAFEGREVLALRRTLGEIAASRAMSKETAGAPGDGDG
jgi:O-antigen/teichoic acid export membrane protein